MIRPRFGGAFYFPLSHTFPDNEWYHTPGQSPGPGVAQATPCSAAEPRDMKPCFPGAHSGMNKFTPLISLGNHVRIVTGLQTASRDIVFFMKYYSVVLSSKTVYRSLLFLILLPFVSFVFTSCLTKPPVADMPLITQKAADLTIKLQPLDYDTLKELYGSNRRDKLNPFIDYPGQIPQRRIVVFDAEFSTEVSTILVTLRDITLAIDGQMGKAASVEYLVQLWDLYIKNTAFSNTIPGKARKTMLPREFTVIPGEPVNGYLVFAEPYPKTGGDGLLRIPVATETGDKGTIEIEISFQDPEADSEVNENSGIFNDSDS